MQSLVRNIATMDASVTSIDVGTKNLYYWVGYYQPEYEECGVPFGFVDWDGINLHAATPKTACESMVEEFMSRPQVYRATDVVTESQAKSIEIMKRLESGICSHFETMSKMAELIKEKDPLPDEVNVTSKKRKIQQSKAQNQKRLQFHVSTGGCKLRVYCGPEIQVKVPAQAKSQYGKRKKLAIEHTRAMLRKRPDLKKWSDWFESLPKKDDAADCFLQGAYFLKKKYGKTGSGQRRERTSVAVYDGRALRFESESESSEDELSKKEYEQPVCEIIEISDDEVAVDLQGIYATLNPTSEQDDNFC